MGFPLSYSNQAGKEDHCLFENKKALGPGSWEWKVLVAGSAGSGRALLAAQQHFT